MSERDPTEPPERSESHVIAERREKLARLRDSGVEPFPHSFEGRTEIAAVRAAHEGLGAGEETEDRYRVAGRIAARRGHGGAALLDLVGGAGRIQLHARGDILGAEAFEALVGLDLGDIAGVEGTVFATKRGELSLRVDDWILLAKSLRPPPDKFHGLEDVEVRYRHRELDLIANPEVRELFMKRAGVIATVRKWLDARGFVEVETPVLQPLYGGALARPFTTHHNALDRDLYLRIATELYLKRLIVGGIDRVYELGKDFRNEGISPKHNPEFTMLEWYEAYADYRDEAERLEQLVSSVAESAFGGTKVDRDGEEIDLSPPGRAPAPGGGSQLLGARGARGPARRPPGARRGSGSRSAMRSRTAPASTSPSAPAARIWRPRWAASRSRTRAGESSWTAFCRS